MAKEPKIVQLINAPRGVAIVRNETAKSRGRGIRVTDRALAFALLEDGSMRAVFIELLPDDNVGVLKLAPANALLIRFSDDG